jgi:hypothetical protein
LIAISGRNNDASRVLLGCKWENLTGEVAARAVPVLVDQLSRQGKNERLVAAQGLKTLYQSGNLPAGASSEILKIKSKLAQPHTDKNVHDDRYEKVNHHDGESSNDCGSHYDWDEGKKHISKDNHTDVGYGEGILL